MTYNKIIYKSKEKSLISKESTGKKVIFSFFFSMFFFLGLFTACKSNFVIPDDANAMQLIQMGQDALSLGSYDKAAKYYNAVIQRFGMDTAIYVEACYELGHLFMKQKQYQKAYGNFEEILNIFETAEFGSLPAAYKKLAQMGMDAIPKRYKKN